MGPRDVLHGDGKADNALSVAINGSNVTCEANRWGINGYVRGDAPLAVGVLIDDSCVRNSLTNARGAVIVPGTGVGPVSSNGSFAKKHVRECSRWLRSVNTNSTH